MNDVSATVLGVAIGLAIGAGFSYAMFRVLVRRWSEHW